MINIDKDKLIPICKEYRLSLIVLFGSQVTGKKGLKQDIDMAVLSGLPVKKINSEYELNLINEFMHFFQASNLDVIILNLASPLLKFNVVRRGKVLFEKEKGLFDRFKILAIKQHLDCVKFYNMEEEYLNNYIEKIKPR